MLGGISFKAPRFVVDKLVTYSRTGFKCIFNLFSGLLAFIVQIHFKKPLGCGSLQELTRY
jgi:hypothetical protein